MSKRQVEIIRLLGMGYPLKRIGEQLQISDKTVEWHLLFASRQFGFPNHTAFWVRLAEAFHLVPRDRAVFP